MKRLTILIPLILFWCGCAYANPFLQLMSGGVAAAVTNGEIGNKSGSDSGGYDIATQNQASWAEFTTGTAGQISYIHASVAYCYGTPKLVNCGLYDSSGNSSPMAR